MLSEIYRHGFLAIPSIHSCTYKLTCHHRYDWNWPVAIFRTCGCPCGFLTSFYCDVTIAPLSDGPFDCDVIMKKFANRCDVGPLAIRQLSTEVMQEIYEQIIALDNLPIFAFVMFVYFSSGWCPLSNHFNMPQWAKGGQGWWYWSPSTYRTPAVIGRRRIVWRFSAHARIASISLGEGAS